MTEIAIQTNTRHRVQSLDLWRAMIMIAMALDHASFFISKRHVSEFWGLPLPEHDSYLEFFTRFVTHFCAPGFFFIMGIGVILFYQSRRRLNWSYTRIIKFLSVRGFLLLIIQQFLENPAWILGFISATNTENFGGPVPGSGGQAYLVLSVLSCLGLTLIFSTLIIKWRKWMLLVFALVSILISQMVVPGVSMIEYPYHPLIRLFFIPGHTGIIQVIYPVLPWFGITAAGMCFAKWMNGHWQHTRQKTLYTSLVLLVSFVIIRVAGQFGNFHPSGDDLIGFLNVTKYPPSLAFITLTMGINLLIFYVVTFIKPLKSNHPGIVIGRTALFFYIAHLWVYAIIGAIFFRQGVFLGYMYLIWAAGLIILYFLCRNYYAFKSLTKPDSVWRFF